MLRTRNLLRTCLTLLALTYCMTSFGAEAPAAAASAPEGVAPLAQAVPVSYTHLRAHET